jgi:hypothetical protein
VIRLIREIVGLIPKQVITAFVYDCSDLIDKETRRELERWNSDQRAWLRRREKNRPREARKAVEAEIKRREYKESAHQPIYRKPWRPHFWNIRDYRKWNVRLRLRSGGFTKVDRQKGGAVRYLIAAAIPWEQLTPRKTQQLLISIGRFYKWHCAWPPSIGVFDDFDPFDQRPSAYLYPEHAPPRVARADKVIEHPARWNYQRLLADKPEHNAKWASCWNIPTRVYRQQGTLNIPRETVETRNNIIENLDRDFTLTETKVA